MPRFIRLLVLPVTGVLFLIAAYFWSQRELNLRLFGKLAEGRVIGMVLQRANAADVLAAIETQLVLSLANGDRVDASYVNYDLQKASYLPANGAAPRPVVAEDFSKDNAASELSSELRRVINDAVRGDVSIIGWALRRESRRPEDPLRVLRVEKIENVRGYVDVTRVPEVFGLRDGMLFIDGKPIALQMGVIRIRGLFDYSDPAAVKARKGEALTEYSYERNGVAATPGKRNFFLNTEPYATQFRPIFAYQAEGRDVARLSHIGRHGGPTLALVLYRPCRVYYDAKNPEQAVVTSVAGPVAGEPLAWFSRFCEGIFGQWGSTALITLAGLLFIVTGLLFIYLALRYGENEMDPNP